jgi:hypothetical protein
MPGANHTMRPQPHPLTYILPVLGMALAWVLLTDQVRFSPLSFSNRLAFWFPFIVAAMICIFTWAVLKEPRQKLLCGLVAIVSITFNVLIVWPIYQYSLYGHPHAKRHTGETYRPAGR